MRRRHKSRALRVWLALVLFLQLATSVAQPNPQQTDSLANCTKKLDRECVTRLLQQGDSVDGIGSESPPLLIAALALYEAKGNQLQAGLGIIAQLFEHGASRDLLAVQALLNMYANHPATPLLRNTLSNPRSIELWRKARDDERIRTELDLSIEDFEQARNNLEALRRSGRFIDYYVAYGVARNVEDIRKAQSLAASRDEFQALEHMAVLTVRDPAEIVEPTVSLDNDTLRKSNGNGIVFSALDDLTPSSDISYTIKLRQTPESRIRLRFASYLANVEIVLGVYRRSATGIDVQHPYPVSINLPIRLTPANYIGAAVFRLSDFKAAVERKAAALGSDLVVSRTLQPKLVRIERLQ